MNQTEVKKNKSLEEKEPIEQPEEKEPIGITLHKAHEDMTIAILQIQNAYGLPAYLTDFLVTAILADIRGCANKELMGAMGQKEK